MSLKVLFAGESWMTYSIHVKGVDNFTTSEYQEGTKWLKGALEANGIEVKHIPNHLAPVAFPSTKEELNQFDVLILSDIGSNTLLLHPETLNQCRKTSNRLSVIKEYIEDGGGLVMFGGWMSFQGFGGRANYKNTNIEEILPVVLLEGDDRVETPEGITLTISSPDHPILEGIPLEWPSFLSYNRLLDKEGATVLARHDTDVMWAVQDYGEGRTMAFAVDCAPHGAPYEYLEWEYYPTIWTNAIKWLARKI